MNSKIYPLFFTTTKTDVLKYISGSCLQICLIITFLGTQITLQAQLERSYYNFNSKDGLNALHVYGIVQDRKGFIWIGTSTGLVQFDGVTFKTIDLPGLRNPEILQLRIDEDDNLWFINLFNQLCRYSPDHNLDIIEIDVQRSFVNIWIKGDNVGVYNEIDDGIIFNRNTLERLTGAGSEFKIPCMNCDLDIFIESGVLYIRKNGEKKKIKLVEAQRNPFRTLFKFGEGLYSTSKLTIYRFVEKDDHYLIEDIHDEQPLYINSISELTDSTIHINTRNGIQIYNLDFKSIRQLEFPNSNVSESIVDNENNLWLSTIDIGLVFSNYSNILSKQPLNDLSITEILKSKESIFIGTVEGKIFLSNEDGIELIHEDNGNYIRFLLEVNNKILIGNNSYIIVYENGKKSKIDVNIKCFKGATKIDDSRIVVGSCTGYRIIEFHEESGFEVLQNKESSRIFCLFYLKNKNSVLLSTISGIHSLNPDTGELTLDVHPNLKEYNIIDIEEGTNGLWLATSNSGVLLYKDGIIAQQYSTSNKLNSNFVNDIYLDREDQLWISTASGINIIDLESQEVNYVTSKDGLNSNIVQTVYVDKDDVYVGTASGLNTYNKNNRFANISAPPIYINSITVDGDPAKLNNLQGQENTFRFNYQGINYSSLGKFTYKYRLKGLTNNWETVPSSISEAVYNRIPPGDYTFEVYAVNEDGVQSLEPAHVSFTMPQPIYSRWWFILISLCVLFGLMNWIFKKRVDQINKESELELNVLSQQLIALKAQMKPHFISNILNSIQSHSMLRDPIKVNQYITRLSRFVRSVLKMSDSKVVSLEDELDVIETYIELEQMRADQSFDYELKVEDSINTKRFFIPPMLIQPYLENAIKHGVSSVEDGYIHINVKEGKDDSIVISIQDNGIGIEDSLKRKDLSKGHISVGTEKNNSRLELLNTIYNKKFGVEISSLSGDKLGPTGTRVNLSIANMSEIANES